MLKRLSSMDGKNPFTSRDTLKSLHETLVKPSLKSFLFFDAPRKHTENKDGIKPLF